MMRSTNTTLPLSDLPRRLHPPLKRQGLPDKVPEMQVFRKSNAKKPAKEIPVTPVVTEPVTPPPPPQQSPKRPITTEIPEIRVVHEARTPTPTPKVIPPKPMRTLKSTAAAVTAAKKKSQTASTAAVKMAEKSPLQSKKFVAYLLAQVVWAVLMILMIYKWQEKALMSAMIGASCVLQIVYLAGQARIDLDLSKGHFEIETDDEDASSTAG